MSIADGGRKTYNDYSRPRQVPPSLVEGVVFGDESMGRNYRYKNVDSKSGEFTLHVDPDTNQMLDIICKYGNRNKSKLCRKILHEWAVNEFEKAFSHQGRLEV